MLHLLAICSAVKRHILGIRLLKNTIINESIVIISMKQITSIIQANWKLTFVKAQIKVI